MIVTCERCGRPKRTALIHYVDECFADTTAEGSPARLYCDVAAKARVAGATAERERIVAWLRAESIIYFSDGAVTRARVYTLAANQIEKGAP